MSRVRLLSISLVTAAALAACSDSTPSGPAAAANTVLRSPTDTSSNGTVTSFDLTGRVLGVDAVAGAGNDTLRFSSIAGAKVRLVRNQLVDGKATQTAVGEVTSSSSGSYQFANLAGGYYVVYVTPPTGSPYGESWSYVAGTARSVEVNVYLWRSR